MKRQRHRYDSSMTPPNFFLLYIFLLILCAVASNKTEAEEYTGHVWEGPVDVLVNPEAWHLPINLVNASIDHTLDYINEYIVLDMKRTGTTDLRPIHMPDGSRRNTVIVVADHVDGYHASASVWTNNSTTFTNGETIFSSLVTAACLPGLMLHEVLHILGIPHTEDPNSIMANNPYNDCQYMRTLREHDIKELQARYPSRPHRGGIVTAYVMGVFVCFNNPDVWVSGFSIEMSGCVPWDQLRLVVNGEIER